MDCLALSTFVSTRLAQKQLIVSMSMGLMFNRRNYFASIVGANRMNLCYICGLFSASLCPPCNCPSVNKYNNVHRRTNYTCPYYTKTFCHTPYCSSLLFTDGQITLAHITPRPSATPPAAPCPVYGWTDYICSRPTATPSRN